MLAKETTHNQPSAFGTERKRTDDTDPRSWELWVEAALNAICKHFSTVWAEVIFRLGLVATPRTHQLTFILSSHVISLIRIVATA
jgi:hypothetical protein